MTHKVLIVEDNPLNMELVADLLRLQGYELLTCGNAEEGLQLARSCDPALVIMDIDLPGMHGDEATRLLKKDLKTCDIPVMALTSSAIQIDRERLMRAGFDAYLTKPFMIEELRRIIEELLPG